MEYQPALRSSVWLLKTNRSQKTDYAAGSRVLAVQLKLEHFGTVKGVRKVVARDGIEPPTPAFSGPPSNLLSGLESP